MMSKIPALSAVVSVDGLKHSTFKLPENNGSEPLLSVTLKKLNFIGASFLFKKTIAKINKFSCSKAPIILEGETGTGKELAARALHCLGPRKDQPFIPVNCGAFPEHMFENELFGHSKGAYTDATSNQAGLIEQARSGTLFLDEIDSLPAKSQVSLLRFLQDKQYRPLGACKMVQSKVTIISATNIDLNERVKQGLFREDLFFRIKVINIAIPSLRDRAEDIQLLAKHFLDYFAMTYQHGQKVLSDGTMHWLINYNWPGNIRELQNLLHKEYLLAEGDVIDFGAERYTRSADIKPLVNLQEHCYQSTFSELRQQVLCDFEYQYLHRLMQKTGGNISEAARMVEKERRSLGRLLEKHGIDKNAYTN